MKIEIDKQLEVLKKEKKDLVMGAVRDSLSTHFAMDVVNEAAEIIGDYAGKL